MIWRETHKLFSYRKSSHKSLYTHTNHHAPNWHLCQNCQDYNRVRTVDDVYISKTIIFSRCHEYNYEMLSQLQAEQHISGLR